MSVSPETPNSAPAAIDADVIVVGGGFSGCYALYKFRQLGLTVKLLEAGTDFGGVWHWNKYPGARVDSESPSYQFSIPKLWKSWSFSERFPSDAEIRRYFKHVDNNLGLRKDAYFSTVVEGATFSKGSWTLNIKGAGTRVARCKYLIAASGSTYKIHSPDFKGLDQFQGQLVHSSAYPQALEVEGKKIALVGSGATGLQILSSLSKKSCHLTNFIRTPVIAMPMRQRKITEEESIAQKIYYSAIFEQARNSVTGFAYNETEAVDPNESDVEREARLEKLWENSGFYVVLSAYDNLLVNKTTNSQFYDFWAKKTRARISDPVKRDIVAPLKQPYYVATKRVSLEQDYYECIDRDNVRVVDLKKDPIVEFTTTGLRTEGESHEFDLIILATGFDSVTGSLVDMKIKDIEGVEIGQKWKTGVSTYLGVTVPGMPNMFVVYGPQAPTSLANGPPIIEAQIDWMASVVQKMRADGIESIDAQPEAAEQWKKLTNDICESTLFKYANSWYMGANIPGKVREPLIYFGGMRSYKKSLENALDGWKGFNIVKAH